METKEASLVLKVIFTSQDFTFFFVYKAVTSTVGCKMIGEKLKRTRSSWFNCALRDDEAVCWVSIGHYEVLAVGN